MLEPPLRIGVKQRFWAAVLASCDGFFVGLPSVSRVVWSLGMACAGPAATQKRFDSVLSKVYHSWGSGFAC